MRWIPRPAAIATNVLVILALIGAVVAITMLANSPIGDLAPNGANWRAALPNYGDTPWARTHFAEWERQRQVYQPYVGWRRADFAGETINVAGEYGERRTAEPTRPGGKVVYFFGGSAMWGAGADDNSTIPSLLAIDHGMRARNFGETAYTAHQSLEMFIRLVQDGHRPDVAVFYDGFDDVAGKCRSESGVFSTADESRLRSRLYPFVGSAQYFIYPLFDLTPRDKPRGARPYDCDADPAKARRVAAALISDWNIARLLAAANGIRFEAFLQPVLDRSRTRTQHLAGRVDADRARQYAAVYPIIEEMMRGTGFRSLVAVLDQDAYIYVDDAHLSPNGNKLVARAIAAALE